MLSNSDKFYPNADNWMWNYCIFLGKFTDSENNNYDLGIHIDKRGDICAAIVDGDEPGDYYSGEINYRKNTNRIYDEKYNETIKRAIEKGYNIKIYDK